MTTRTLLPLAIVLLTSTLHAEEAAPEKDRENAEPEYLFGVKFDLDFPGGRLDELLLAAEAKLGARPNVILQNEVRSAAIPEFQLRNVDLLSILKALHNFLAPQDIDIDLESERGQVVVVIISQNIRRSPLGHVIQREVRPFDLSQYLKRYSVDDLVTTIETSWELQEEKTDGTLRYHEETHILLVAGTQKQISAVQEILNVLHEQIVKERQEAGSVQTVKGQASTTTTKGDDAKDK